MTDAPETPTTEIPAADAPARGNVGALLLALLALVIAVAGVVVPHVPALQRYLPRASSEAAPDYGNTIGMLQQQVRQLAETKSETTPASEAFDATPLTARIDKLEQQLIAADVAISEAKAKAQDGTVKPVSLAFLRVENRLLRGEPFTSELRLLKQNADIKLSPEQDRDLTAAASGVRTTADLLAELRTLERAARRAERMATVDGPLARIWAELQSLVMIKDNSTPAAPDDRFTALILAVRQGDKATTEAAWQPLSQQAKQVLYPVYGEVERRQRAEEALKQFAPTALATQ